MSVLLKPLVTLCLCFWITGYIMSVLLKHWLHYICASEALITLCLCNVVFLLWLCWLQFISCEQRPNVHCVPKNETHSILNILYSCKSVAWNLAFDILMTLAIKRVHNLPPHLTYVPTLPDITQKLKHSIDTWERIPQGISDKPLTNDKYRCVQRQRDVTSYTYCDLSTQPAQSHFRHTETGSFQSHSHYWEADNRTDRCWCDIRERALTNGTHECSSYVVRRTITNGGVNKPISRENT